MRTRFLQMMRWGLMPVILAMGAAFGADAQVIATVGTGTGTSSGTNGLPIYRSSATSAFHYSRSASLYTTTNLASIPFGATITAVAFNKTTAATLRNPNTATFNILMKNTANTVLNGITDWTTFTTGATSVYSNTAVDSTLLATAGWVTFTFPTGTSFTYTGGSIEVYTDWAYNGTPTTPFSTAAFPFQVTTTTGIQSVGTSNSSPLTGATVLSSTNTQLNNIQFTYTAPASCSGAPTAGTIIPAAPTGCVGSTTTFTVSGYTLAGGISRQWQSSTTSATSGFTDIAGATGVSYTTPAATTTTYYRVKVRCGTTDSSFTPAVTYTIAPPTITVATLPYNQSFESWISTCATTDRPGTEWLVQPFTTDSAWRRNDQGASAGWTSVSGGYSPAFTAGAYSARFHTYDVSSSRSGSMLLNLDMSQTGSKIISFDHINTSGTDSLFVELSTNGGTSYTLLGGYGIAATWTRRTLISSATAANAILRFRARSDYGTTDIGMDSLNIFVTNCLPVTSTPTVSAITNTGATITWTAASSAPSNGYDYYVSTSNATPSFTQTPTGNVATGLTVNLTALSANTTYYVWVRGNCGTSTSIWSAPATFTTACNPIATFPYAEGFETAGFPSCWSNALISGTNNWATATGPTDIPGPVAGSRYIYKAYNTSTANLYSPAFNLSSFGATQARINFWVYRFNVTAQPDSIRFLINTSTSTTGATPLITVSPYISQAPVVSAAGWYNYTANIPVSFNTATPAYIVIQGVTTAGFSSYDLGIDSFRLEQVPTCAPPTGVALSGITPTGVTINWTAPTTTTPTSYRWEVRTSGLPGSGSTGLAQSGPVTAPTTTQNVTGLTPGTTYRVYVRSYCGTSDSSTWSFPAPQFTTPASCSVPTTLTATGIIPNAANLAWTNGTFGSATTWQISYGVTGTTAANGTKIIVNQNPYTLGSLTPATGYVFFVRAICSPGDTSAWSSSSSFTTPPTCSVPTALTATGITPNTVNLGWTAGTFGGATSWQISYGVTGTTAVAGTKVIVTANSYTLGSLTPATGYVYFVRSICSPGDTSAWSSSTSFTTAPSCSVPTALTATGITTTSANLGWTTGSFGGATQWQISYGTSGTTAANGTKVVAPANPYSLSGLTSATAYVFYVRAICAPGDTSAWSSSFAFTTLCVPSALPFAEDFNTFLPSLCWTRATGYLTNASTLTSTISNSWGADGFMNVGTTGAARINLYTTGKRDWFITPSIDLGATAGNYIVEFNMGVAQYNTTTPDSLHMDDTVAVVVSYNNGTTWSAANALRVWTMNDGSLAGQRYYFPIMGSGQIKVGFYASEGPTAAGANSTSGDNDIFFDSLRVTQCIAPTVALGTDTTLCGANTSLTLDAGPGTGYTWSTGSTTQTINVSTPGTYTVNVINGSPGCSRRDTIVVNTGLIPTVALGPDTAVCGNVLSFPLNAGNPGSNYAWSSPAANLTVFTTQVIDLGPIINASNFANAGSTPIITPVYASVTNASGCVGRDTVNVSVTPTARVSDFTISGTDPAFTFTPVLDSFTTTYMWNFGDGTTGTGNPATHTYNTNGSYTVTLMVGNQCGVTDTVIKTRQVTAGVKGATLDGATITLYPNPTAADAVLAVEGSAKLRGYQVLNAAGALIADRRLDGVTRTTLNTASFAPGIYTLRIQLDKGVVVRKLEVIK